MLNAAQYAKTSTRGIAFGLDGNAALVHDLRALADAIEAETCVPQTIRTDTEAGVEDFTFQTLTFRYALPANGK